MGKSPQLQALVKNQRQLTDDQIRILIERGAVIGGVLDAWMLTEGWIGGFRYPKRWVPV